MKTIISTILLLITTVALAGSLSSKQEATLVPASSSQAGTVDVNSQSFTGLKNFLTGLLSGEEVLIDSTAHAYASVRTANTVGNSKDIAFASGDSVSGTSGNASFGVGGVTKTLGAPIVVQGLTLSNPDSTGKQTGYGSFQIITDNTNVPTPSSPFWYTRGGSGQRLVVRLNSATTVSDAVTAFSVSGISGYTVSGAGATTFTDTIQPFVEGVDAGETNIFSDWRNRLGASTTILGQQGIVNGQVALNSEKAGGSDNSNTIFILSGQVDGTGSSGGIAIRSSDMQGNGGSGGTFIRTGTVNGSASSGNTNISTGQVTQFGVTNSGVLNLNTGNHNGSTGNSGAINLSSGNSGTVSGQTGNVTLGSGSKNNSLGTGNSGQLFMGSGNSNSTLSSNTGSVTLVSGNLSAAGTGSTGQTIISTGTKAASSTGNTGNLTLTTGQNSGAGNSGDVILSTGTVSGGVKGRIKLNDIINLPTVSNPSPSNGDIWFDGTNFNVRSGGVTRTLNTTP
jgi:hypothetical protein